MPAKQIKYSQVLLTYPQCEKSKDELMDWLKQNEKIECAIVCHENHHETEGEHLHAWIKFKVQQQVTASKWGTLFDWEDIHGNYQRVTVNMRSIADTVKYVMKDGDVTIWNCNPDALMNPKSHERKYNTKHILETDIKELVENNEIAPRDYNAIIRAQTHWKLINTPIADAEHTKGVWIVGPPRIGKSKSVRVYGEKHGGLYIKAQNKWWDGYRMEPNILIDDFDTTSLWHHLKLWADCYSFPAEVKGATVTVNFKHLFITSNYTIEELMKKENRFEFDNTLYQALTSRFIVIDWNDYCERHEWLTCELIENVLGEEINEPENKKSPSPE